VKVRDKFAIRTVLWRGVANHYPHHIHVDFNPAGIGTPKCAGGNGGWDAPWNDRVDAFRKVLKAQADSSAVYGISFARFPGAVDLGVYNCRPIAGSSTWSQHAYRNAQDIGFRGGENGPLGDRIVAWLESEWTGDDEMTDKEKAQLAEALEKAREANARFTGVILRLEGKPEPAEAGFRRWGWRFANRALSEPNA
jgi:hypothetical protein